MTEPIRLEETAADVMVRQPQPWRDRLELGECVPIAELARLRANSARWEKVRRHAYQSGDLWIIDLVLRMEHEEEFDAAVDAAIAAERKGAGK